MTTPTETPTKPSNPHRLRSWIESILEAALIVLLMFCLCWPIQIHGVSMEPTLYSGDRVFISRVLVLAGQISRGDLIVCKIQENGHTENIIKRVIGLPGDEVAITNHAVYINGESLIEPYAGMSASSDLHMTLAAGNYFVIGDNLSTSVDSRELGPIPKKDMVGKVIFRFFPFNQIKLY